MSRVAVAFWVGAAIAFVSTGMASAQEIAWRSDYAAARREAVSSGRPLVLNFGTESCIWCRKLDATTFRDRGVATLIGERFIAVKVDGDKDEWLCRAAGVHAFPTLVMIAPDGRVLARHDGYADVAKMTALLRQAAAAAPPKPVASSMPAERSAAVELLALARSDHGAGRYLACVERCDRLMAAYPKTPEAAEAGRIIGGVTSDPAKWGRVTGQLREDLFALQKDLDAALGR